jgi:hypothetical protein
MDEIKPRPNKRIDKKKLLIFFAVFVTAFYLLDFMYVRVLRLIFSDLAKQISEGIEKMSMPRYHELIRWRALEPLILLITLSLTCVYIVIFKRNYFKESIIAFLLFIVALFTFGFLSKVYTKQQEKDNGVRNKSLIVGKWNHTNRVGGNVTIVFNKDSTGYRFTDSNKTVQKFRYDIYRGSFLTIYFESNKHEFFRIGSLTIKTLSIKAPFSKIKNNVYESNFTRGSP